jgi:excisionase family DNA binding protein
MTRYLYEVELRPDVDGGYCVRVPDLEGCLTEGDTVDEALEMAVDALKTYGASLMKHGDAIASPTFGHRAPEGGMVVAVSFETDASYIIDAVPPSEAAVMLNVSRGRVSQLIREGVLTATKGYGGTLVDLKSIEERLASPRAAGRPRKELVQA